MCSCCLSILLSAITRKTAEFYSFEDTYFHYLVPEDIEEESSDEEWHGKLAALEKTIKFEGERNNNALGGPSAHYLRRMILQLMFCLEIRRDVKDELAAMFDRMRKVEETMGAMRTDVNQILQKLAGP